MFVELYGNFYLGSTYCTNFCGTGMAVSVGDDLQAQQIYVSGSSDWEAFVADQSVSGYPYITVIGGPSLGGSLPYAMAALEAGGASSNSYISTPVDINNFGVANSAFNQVNLDTSVMLNWIIPTASSGVTLSYSATGSTYGTISIT